MTRIFWLRVWIAVCAALMLLGAFGLRDDRALQAGRVTEGIVSDLKSRIGRSGAPAVKYHFIAEGTRETTEVWNTLPRAAYNQLKVGGPIAVRYVPDRPSTNRPAAADPSWEDGAAALLVGAVNVVLGMVALRSNSPRIKRWREDSQLAS
ncbi:hypothetical protein [Roseateles sp. P5_E7]